MVSEECLWVKGWVCLSRRRCRVSGLCVCHPTSSEELADLIDNRLGVANMVGSSLASGATFAFQGPGKADFRSSMLRDGDFMTLHKA
jgi:hypothetical protein